VTSFLDSAWLPALILLILIVVLMVSVRFAPEFTRFAVYRGGRLSKIMGPGLFLIIPIVDRLVRFKVDETKPDWASMSFDQARQYVDHRVLEGRAHRP